MPRDFSEDGAFGAAGGGDGSPSAGSPTGGVSVNDPGPAPSLSDGLASYTQHMIGANGDNTPDAGVYKTGPGGVSYSPLSAEQQAGNAAYTQNMGDGSNPTPGTYKSGPSGFSFTPSGGSGSGVGLWMEDGGAIDDTNGSPDQDAIQKALSTVDGVLAFGRKLHGLGGGDNEGAIQTASNMPTVPASQSESGVPPLQPRPGALPPTNNPFGKRRTAENEDDSGGAIDTTEEETA